jgi:hypothetical protein
MEISFRGLSLDQFHSGDFYRSAEFPGMPQIRLTRRFATATSTPVDVSSLSAAVRQLSDEPASGSVLGSKTE